MIDIFKSFNKVTQNMLKLLAVGKDSKTIKGEKFGYLTGILYLAPANEANPAINLCPKASAGCRAACLFTAGHGRMSPVKKARIRKTNLFLYEKDKFFEQLISDISFLKRKAAKRGKIPCIRLNGTSDIPWEKIKFKGKNIFNHFPEIQWYDYTKSKERFSKKLPKNYHLTFSRSEENEEEVKKLIRKNVNIAVVFTKVPNKFMNRKVINGDLNDLRFLDEKGIIVGLKAKGKAKKDFSGFVI